MKYRTDFVTNSSSSSFIISKSDINKNDLMKLLLELANIDAEDYGYEPYTEEDMRSDGVSNFYILDSDSYDKNELAYWFDCSKEEIPKGKWLINNGDCSHYSWEDIEEIMRREGINWSYGYCS